MRKKSNMLLIAILTTVFFYGFFVSSYIPEQTLILDQVVLEDTAIVGTNIEVGIFVKNYLNYTITNITVSLNLTDSDPFHILKLLLVKILVYKVRMLELHLNIQAPQ